MPLVAAAGGLAGTALVFLTFVTWRDQPMLTAAWPVAAAIDIAAGYYVLTSVFRRGAAFPFLLLIAVATDAAGLLAMALWAGFTEAHLLGAPFVLLGVAIAAGLRRAGVRHLAPYVFGAGAVSWWGFHVAGVPAALALMPVVPFLPPARRLLAPFADRPGGGVDREARPWLGTVHVVLFFFGLANGGVPLRGYDTGTWAVLLAALVGRPLGILAAVAAARTTGLRLPQAIGWRELTVIALATSSGFTFALFAAASLLPVGGVLTQIRVGAVATVAGAIVTVLAARALRVGRYAHPSH
jgi:NhaA family Na+:H+ antiporter